MAAGTHVNDAGTWRKLRNVYVNDAGTWRTISKVYVNDAGTWRTVFQRGDAFSITAGSLATNRGYVLGSIGSISSGSILPDGRTVNAIVDTLSNSRFVFAVESFGANPGQGYLTSIVVNNIEYVGASATAYTYQATAGSDGSGLATWAWNGIAGLTNGVGYTGFIARS